MKIVFLDTKTLGDDISLDIFEQLGEVVKYETSNTQNTQAHISDADIIVTNKVIIDKEIMDNSNIKLICVAATGMNNIDLQHAKEKNIEVKNVKGYSTASVAQLTFGIVLQFINKINYYDEYVKSGQWSKSDIFTHLDKPFFDLEHKKWGIIGLGSIGQSVAKIASSFGCEVSYFSTSGKNTNDTYKQNTLEELLKNSDIISIHAPLNDDTMNLINKSNMSLLKNDCILLNLGRGGIVNEEDVTNHIKEMKNIFYGTDVITKEPISAKSPLLDIEANRVIFTPHIAWASIEARKELVKSIFQNIKQWQK